ncbi:hypothetical protein GXB85_13650 [Cellulomonas sp. APG4]|uniref:hypothetical protein n=1 Tax=Cellulomonas sp. APG4 TaxID=1538656 RepID=UPI00137AED24|nr:hypothetical protein [Cellulomonas sp. APG4]NCT91987.1 hypothetical protein [Cellulomonas sp. APG4]
MTTPPTPLPEPLRARVQSAAGTWLSWCALHEVDAHTATATTIIECVMELRRGGAHPDDLADIIDAAGLMVGMRTWLDPQLLALRRSL